jgi:hypothetical protein
MKVGRMQAGELDVMQRDYVLLVVGDRDVRSHLVGMAERRGGIGKRRLTELEHVDIRREIVDRIRAEVWLEYKCVGSRAANENKEVMRLVA